MANEIEITVRIDDQSREGYRHATQGADEFGRRTEENLNKSRDKFNLLGKAAGLAGGAMAAGAAVGIGGLVALGGFLVQGVKDAQSYQVLQAKTAQVIKSTGNAAHISVKGIQALAGELEGLSGVDEELIIHSQNVLATFTNIKNVGKDRIFDEATKSALDMSVALKSDLAGASIQVGKALNDPIKGVGALSKVGVTFTDTQKEVIKQMVKTGDVAGAQKIILAELNKEFGGQAAAAGATFQGSMDRVKDAIGDTGRAIGQELLPKLTEAADFMAKNIPVAVEQFKAGWQFGDTTTQIGSIAVALKDLGTSLSDIGGEVSKDATFTDFFVGMARQIGNFIDDINHIGPTWQVMSGTVQRVAQGIALIFDEMVLGVLRAGAKLPLGMGDKFKEMIPAAEQSIAEVQSKLDSTNTDIARARLENMEIDLRQLGRQEPTPKVKADISDLQRKIAYARAALRGIPNERVDIYVNTNVTKTVNFVENIIKKTIKSAKASGGVQGAASGGPRGNWTMVGEEGRELVKLAPGSTVIPNGQTEAMMKQGASAAGASGGMVLEIKSGGSRMDDLLVEIIRKAIRGRGGNAQSVLGS